ncbi:MAG: ribose 5-phosphate isomerase B [Geopsychrobacter sp.]|nr:ribose 5-phosphate isomerase B [Geopsychrobacter sp.]
MIAVASDHGGLELKQAICELLKKRTLDFCDMGTHDGSSVDYPDFGIKVATAVAAGECLSGILICGTGIGMSIAANKVNGIRAALVHDSFTAQMAKEHNNANVLVLGGRVLGVAEGCRLVEVWLDSQFEGGRHQGRLDKIQQIENDQK